MHLIYNVFVTENGISVKAETVNELVLHMTLLNFVSRFVNLALLKCNSLLDLFLGYIILFTKVLMGNEASKILNTFSLS